MRESKTLYFCRFSVHFFFSSSETYSWNMKNNVYQHSKRSNEVVSSGIRTLKKKTVKQNLFKRFTLQAIQKQKFSHSQNTHQNILHFLSQRNILASFMQPHPLTMLQRWWLQARKNLLHWILFHFCILMKCNAIDILCCLCTISLGRNRMW